MSTLTMQAILANVFLAVQTQLTTLPELLFIDQDLGQLEFDEKGSPVKFPCSLFDICEIRYTDNSNDSQMAEAVLEVRLGLTAYAAATHYYTNNSHRINALEYFNLELIRQKGGADLLALIDGKIVPVEIGAIDKKGQITISFERDGGSGIWELRLKGPGSQY